MGELNLLDQYPKARRDIASRKQGQEANREAAKLYGREYFDGSREQGYGGYIYDGRWQSIARRIIEHYGLRSGDKVLDIGCAKGFLVKDLSNACPGLEVYGADVSTYALENCHPDSKNKLVRASADALPFSADCFNAVLCINVIHNLELVRCRKAIQEIERVGLGNTYIQVDAYRTDAERGLFLDWVLTAVTFGTLDYWREIFAQTGYSGDYYWTIIEQDPEWVVIDNLN